MLKVISGHWPSRIGDILSVPASWDLEVSFDYPIPDHTTPVRDNCGQSELPWKSKTDEKSKNIQSMYKRGLPLESECSWFLEHLEIEQKLQNVQIQKVGR